MLVVFSQESSLIYKEAKRWLDVPSMASGIIPADHPTTQKKVPLGSTRPLKDYYFCS